MRHYVSVDYLSPMFTGFFDSKGDMPRELNIWYYFNITQNKIKAGFHHIPYSIQNWRE